jgi:hypothetical protein
MLLFITVPITNLFAWGLVIVLLGMREHLTL